MRLRIRSAESAPGTGALEYFARVPESVLTDRDCSLPARAFYAVVRLDMEIQRNPKVCLTPLGQLATSAGIGIRQARRLVAELERRGHVHRERIRSISGSPQGIRPTAEMRQARARSNVTECKRTQMTGTPVIPDHAPGQIRPSARTRPTAPTIKRERERSLEPEKVAGSIGVRPEDARPPAATAPEEETDSPAEIAAALASLRARIHSTPATPARKKAAGSSAKTTPRPESRNSVPDAKDCTAGPAQESRHEFEKEHNNY